jgi:hypothetical protein
MYLSRLVGREHPQALTSPGTYTRSRVYYYLLFIVYNYMYTKYIEITRKRRNYCLRQSLPFYYYEILTRNILSLVRRMRFIVARFS